MRVAMLSWETMHSIAVGGVAVHVTELAAALERAGHEVHVFTRLSPGQRHHDWIDGVHYHRCAYPAHHEFVDDVNSMCRSFVDRVFTVEDMLGQFDIVHAHDWLTANAMIWIKQGRDHRGMLTIHSTEYARCGNTFPGGRSARVRGQERAGTYWADKVICVSHATRREINWMYEVPEWKTQVVYNGVNSQRFSVPIDVGVARRVYDIGPLDPAILFCGRLEWQKGPDLLVQSIPEILRKFFNAKYVFAGDGAMRHDVEIEARQLGVSHAVRFLGHQDPDEVATLYKLADGVCVPSRNEPFGLVVLEAWSAGKPVVASENGGPAELVKHEFNGLLVAPRPDSIAWAVGRLFADFERARWMGENGRSTVDERYMWESIAGQTVDVYESVLPRPVAQPRPALCVEG
jgi:glycosyltransferase involved in cell wall biosynthesis